MDAFAFSAASDAAQTLVGRGWMPQFRGLRQVFRVNHSQVRRAWLRYVYIAAVQPACRIMGGAEGVMLPPQLCVRGLGSCAPGGYVWGGQGV